LISSQGSELDCHECTIVFLNEIKLHARCCPENITEIQKLILEASTGVGTVKNTDNMGYMFMYH